MGRRHPDRLLRARARRLSPERAGRRSPIGANCLPTRATTSPRSRWSTQVPPGSGRPGSGVHWGVSLDGYLVDISVNPGNRGPGWLSYRWGVGSSATNERVVPVHEEPRHRLVHESAGLRLLDVRIPAGDVTLFHSHDDPTLYVTVRDARVATQRPGENWEHRS